MTQRRSGGKLLRQSDLANTLRHLLHCFLCPPLPTTLLMLLCVTRTMTRQCVPMPRLSPTMMTTTWLQPCWLQSTTSECWSIWSMTLIRAVGDRFPGMHPTSSAISYRKRGDWWGTSPEWSGSAGLWWERLHPPFSSSPPCFWPCVPCLVVRAVRTFSNVWTQQSSLWRLRLCRKWLQLCACWLLELRMTVWVSTFDGPNQLCARLCIASLTLWLTSTTLFIFASLLSQICSAYWVTTSRLVSRGAWSALIALTVCGRTVRCLCMVNTREDNWSDPSWWILWRTKICIFGTFILAYREPWMNSALWTFPRFSRLLVLVLFLHQSLIPVTASRAHCHTIYATASTRSIPCWSARPRGAVKKTNIFLDNTKGGAKVRIWCTVSSTKRGKNSTSRRASTASRSWWR